MQRLVVVTGAASGIGHATLRTLIDQGDRVLGVDIAAAPEELKNSPSVKWVRGDVSAAETWDQVKNLSLQIQPAGADCLAACAGDQVVAPFLETSIEQWRRLFEINVMGVLRGLHTLLPSMIARRSGAVAVVCSVSSLFAEDQLSAYATSKAALLHVTRQAALEYARYGVRINAICPGAIDTPMQDRYFERLGDVAMLTKATEMRTPTGKIIRPEEVAAVMRFVLSSEASALSGAAIVVDGGVTTAYDFGLDRTPPIARQN